MLRTIIVVQLLYASIALVSGQSCSNQPMTPALRAKMLEKHNDYRSAVASGTAELRGGSSATRGKNIYKLIYDCELEDKAQQWANGCDYKHSDAKWRNSGENIYKTYSTSQLSIDEDKMNVAADLWGGELAKYGIGNSYRYSFSMSSIGHWTQMVWGKTTRVGCGVASCPYMTPNFRSTIYVVCHYLDMGNFENQQIYEFGNGCSSNSDCTMIAGSTCDKEKNLCLQPGETTVVEPPVITNPNPNPLPRPVARACNSRKMSPANREYITRTMNTFRSEVVKGRAANRRPGKNMYKLTYDCDLEIKAQTLVDRCDITKTDQGAIMYFDGTGDRPLKRVKALQTAIGKWKEGISRLSSYISSSDDNLALEQLIWGASTKVGCGVKMDCSVEYQGSQFITTIVACYYEKIGNIPGENIYEAGNPCERHSDCTTFTGSTCDRKKRLCVAPSN